MDPAKVDDVLEIPVYENVYLQYTDTTVFLYMLERFSRLHTIRGSSVKSGAASRTASSQLNSRASFRVILILSRSTSRVLS
jgi:hypothetical protein